MKDIKEFVEELHGWIATRDLRQLLEENLIVQEGLGRGVKYKKP